jgi:hypothetical protein
MTTRKNFSKPFRDTERPYETVADSFTDGRGHELLTVRLKGLWSDLIRVGDEPAEASASSSSSSALPLIDEMKGILRWD